jgi:uncharacterized protein YyaL (SSP411 family)
MTGTNEHKHTNSLINESSPYLLQHAHNPVSWYPWGEEALSKAKKEDKLMLISIGYSACHWCHVMERESFENEQVASIMNNNFICIKVDREERPDIDQVYMNAVQLMTGHGGWPLNCFALPDGRPVYGGTYFPREQWVNVLANLADVYKNERDKVLDYAEQLTEGVRLSELVRFNDEKPEFSIDTLYDSYRNWSKRFDNTEGGPNKAPKFPLPNNYQFLLRYWHHIKDESVLKHVKLTLEKMAFGGIYDQLGGGFARYSTDTLWKVPHFEKMLYDNAQLVTLYCDGYRALKDPVYKQVVYETLEFISRELTSPEGAFYSALDADSEGEEGKFYVWTKEELQQALGDRYDIFAAYYNVNDHGYWEHGNYILLRRQSDEKVAKALGLNPDDLRPSIEAMKRELLAIREKRVRPGLDDKTLTSWNALMIKGYTDAYNTFGEPSFLAAAVKNAQLILGKLRREDGGLLHSYKNGKATINGYLEDYSCAAEAFISLYEATFEERWLHTAAELVKYSIDHFYDENSRVFWFTSDLDPPLVARKMEVADNVTPASNSIMARVLFTLGHHLDNREYIEMAKQMINNIKDQFAEYGAGYSNWGMLLIDLISPFYEVAIVGKDVNEKRKELAQHYLPNKIFAGSMADSALPLLENKYEEGRTLIYVCENRTCQRPVSEVSEAVNQLLQ